MRILADENLHFDIVLRLRQANHEVVLVSDVGLTGHKDLKILEVLDREVEVFKTEKSVIIVLSEGRYRIHKAGKFTK